MALNWPIKGHKKQLAFLEKSIAAERLAHAYIFAGPASVGKKTVAKHLANLLMCETGNACGICPNCNSLAHGTNPDLIELSQDETIKIEQVRKLIYQLNLKPYQSRYKVLIIDDADDMTIEAANALLKSIEEPKDYTIVILITSNPYKLLPTISSRAQKVNFGLVDPESYADLLPKKLSKEQTVAIENYAYGRPGVALAIANDDTSLEKLQLLEESYKTLTGGNLGERLVLASRVAEEADYSAKDALDFWLSSLEKQLIGGEALATAALAAKVALARNLLDANVNTKLLLTNIMLDAK